VFYQHVRMAELNEQQQTHVTVFTTELFAHYLHIKCLSITKCQQLSDTTNSQSSTCEVQLMYITYTKELFIADVLLWKLGNVYYDDKFVCMQQTIRRQYTTKYPCALNTTLLVELLQKSAIEHLITFRQIEARDILLVMIVTTDFDALYAYKLGEYQHCLQLSTQNVCTLLYRVEVADIPTFPEFIQLMDDDIVSLTALTLIVNPKCREESLCVHVTQLTLSLYLMTQCQLKLRHSVTLLAQTLDYIKFTLKKTSS